MATSDNAFFKQFVQFGTNGTIDKKKTLQAFEAALTAHLKAQEDIQPAILAELKQYERLGEGTLISFVLHALRQPVTGENTVRVRDALKELADEGKITYQTNEKGGRKGRQAGWVLAAEK